MFDYLTQKFSSIFSRFSSEKLLSDKNIEDVITEIQSALIEADIPFDLCKNFIEQVKTTIKGQQQIKGLKPKEQILKVVHDTLIQFLGAYYSQFETNTPSVIMVVGLQGSGKTTSIAKLTHYLSKTPSAKAKKILCASVDFYRPAAIDQLELMAQKVGSSFYRASSIDPVQASCEIYEYYKKSGFDVLILDTAGRLHVDSQMLEEVRAIDAILQPACKVLVLDAMTGQESYNVASAFNSVIAIHTGILSKMDSDTRGGAAFSFYHATKKPILLLGTGEKPEDYEKYHPKRLAGRIMGMGDMQSLIEKANEKIKESEQKSMESALLSGKMTLDDFANQLDMIGKLGAITKVMKYIPGLSGMKLPQGALEQGDAEMKMFRVIIKSMTPKERFAPKIIDGSRKKRIAQGAGVGVDKVNILLQRFEQMKQYAKLLKNAGPFSKMFR